MRVVVGVFKSRSNAEAGSAKLTPLGLKKDKIHILTPEAKEGELAAIPTMETEQPGIVKALGAVVGGAVGFGVVEALSYSLVPGVGPVLAIGLAGGTLLGALTGGTTAGAIENTVFDGLPEDELFVYEDVLRQGRTLVIASPEDESQAEAARGALEYAGAETIDRAHEMWWLGLRDVEKEKYESKGWKFGEDERYFRAGFEAALHARNRDKSYEEFRPDLLVSLYSVTERREAFRRGYDRGRAYSETIRNRQS